jgi:threonine/homoserine/homoserine lactone efflux protein
MDLITHLFFGFFFAFVGSITPSMLNMTALKISLENDKKSTIKYILGVSLIVLMQTYIAVVLTKYISENPTIIESLEKVGILIFIILSIYFYKESKKGRKNFKESKTKKQNHFITGITLSILNMFSIPFFCGTVVGLDVLNLFNFDIYPVLFFILGSGIGTFYILYLYAKFAIKIQKKTGKITKDINIVLSVLTAIVALLSIVKLIYNLTNS